MLAMKTSSPLVSIIMSVYNEEKYVTDAIQSILNQTYENFELITIDDYSTDHSLEIIKNFKDPRIRVHSKTDEPRHLAASRNLGIKMARGEYILLQDADDACDPTRIEKQLARVMTNPGRLVVGTSVRIMRNNRECVSILPETHSEIIKGLRRQYNRSTIVAGTILASKEIFLEFPYRLRFKYMQDWDHILRMYESGNVEFYNCQEPLYTYKIHRKSVRFKPEWLDYNIFVRCCQRCRKNGIEEFRSLEEFREYLRKHLIQRVEWQGLRTLIKLRLWISQ